MAKMNDIDIVIEGLLIFRSLGVAEIGSSDNLIEIQSGEIKNTMPDFNKLKLYQLGWMKDKHGTWSIDL